MLSGLDSCKSAASRTFWTLKEQLHPVKKKIASEIQTLRKTNLSEEGKFSSLSRVAFILKKNMYLPF